MDALHAIIIRDIKFIYRIMFFSLLLFIVNPIARTADGQNVYHVSSTYCNAGSARATGG